MMRSHIIKKKAEKKIRKRRSLFKEKNSSKISADRPTKKVLAALEYDCGQKSSGVEVIKIDSRYLSDALSDPLISQSLRQAEMIFIKSTKGTGKTQFSKKHIESLSDGTSVVQIGHRRSLSRASSKQFTLICYLDNPEPTKRYAISIDSLDIAENRPEGWDVVIIDESEQVFRHLLSDTTKEKRGVIFKTLRRLINQAKQVICMDADLTGDLTGYVISKLRRSFEHERSIAINNEYKVSRDIELYESKSHIIVDLMCDLFDGKRVYVPVGELNLAKRIKALTEAIVKPDGTPIKTLMLTGETSNEETCQAFFKNPNNEAVKYQCLIATSTLSTGVSIDVEWFDAVYGIFDGSVYTFQDCDQAISRVRNCEVVKVWIHNGVKKRHSSMDEIRCGPVKKEMATRSYTSLDEDGRLSEAEELYMDVDATIRWCEEQWKENRIQQFIDLKDREGWLIVEIGKDKGKEKAGKEMLKFGGDPEGNKRATKIINARNLTIEEFDELKDVKNLRGADGDAKAKYLISEFFNVHPNNLSLTQVSTYYENDFRSIVKSARLVTADRKEAIQRDRYERTNKKNEKAFIDFEHRSLVRDIRSAALEICSIKLNDVLKRAHSDHQNEVAFENAKAICSANLRQCRTCRPCREASKKRNETKEKLKWVVTQQQIDALAEYANENLEKINLYLGTNFKDPTAKESKTKVFNTIMGSIGITVKKGRVKSDSEDSPEYFIDYGRLRELVASKSVNEILGL